MLFKRNIRRIGRRDAVAPFTRQINALKPLIPWAL